MIKRVEIKRANLFLILVVLLMVFLIAQQVVLTGDSVKAVKNATNVQFPIYLDNNESVVGFQVEVNYSTSDLILQDVETTSRLPSATIVFNDQPPIVKIAVLVNNESDKITSGNDSVLNLIFDVDEFAVSGNHMIDIFSLIIVNISAIALNASEVDGLFEIVEPHNVTFLPPVANFENFTLQNGATLPFKFNVTENGNFIEDDSVLVRIFNLSLGIDHTYNASEMGNEFIDIQEDQYNINMKTGSNGLDMPEGIYNIEVTFDNLQLDAIMFELVDKGLGIGKGRN